MRKIILNRYSFLCLSCLTMLVPALAQQNLRSAQTASAIYYSSENLRSDTFDILKYTVNLEIGSSVNTMIGGHTRIRFVPKQNNRTFIRFDLLRLSVDSVKENAAPLSYTYNDTIIKINFAAPKNTADTSLITVFYHGTPQIDATGWGGFYFDNTQNAEYAFNLGIGFGASPHNYGRTWHPCFDNFVERARYEFNIVCDAARTSYCNGKLMGDSVFSTKRLRKWVLNNEIPSYLASISVANYAEVNWSVNTLTGIKPIILAGVAGDTTAMKAGFVHLPNCIQGFEHFYGPYAWNRFGYCLVPFSGGAMEHATNITYPRAFIGNLSSEADLMAHELSHHWWGDLVTCETQEDMWINEGMATFSSYLFLEWQYGKARYLSSVKTEHDNLLHFLHKTEGGFRAISGVPHDLTYGDHVYKKGADVAHTLRGYLGDSAFFAGAKYILQTNAFKSLNSAEYRDLMQTGSGKSLGDFFANWVFSGGWPHFKIDSVRYITSAGNYSAVVSVKQSLFGAAALYNSVPLEISFFKNDWSSVTKTVSVSGAASGFTLALPYSPVYCALNYDSKISDATSHEYKTVKSNGSITWTLAKAVTNVSDKGADSSLIRIVHNYVKPDPFRQNPQGHRLSDQHYWKVEGILSPGFASRIRFNYDGTKATSGNYAYMDTSLAAVNGDSIRLFYRRDASDDWRLITSMHKQNISAKTGYIEADTLKLGEYAFGTLGDTIATGIVQYSHVPWVHLFPNPAKHSCTIELSEMPAHEYTLGIVTLEGKTVLKRTINAAQTVLDLSQLAKGTYLVRLEDGKQIVHSQKIVVE